MKRRIPESYTVMIIRTDKEPLVFSIQPIAVWAVGASLAVLVVVSFMLGWSLGRSTQKAELPIVDRFELT